ncbi:hypothetical protein ABS768_07710 [Flavobacterium sp. ST-75]|uniref:Restriction endonuclease type IV Mrr domain-containing protein n=1 Tax=Flavobacterium rhizophilum TaxID=3163296 RepID=A0ABW8YDV1_9FLAO
MKVVTKLHFENFLQLLDEVAQTQSSDLNTLNTLLKKTNSLIDKCREFDLLELDNIDKPIEKQVKINIKKDRKIQLILKLYWVVVENLYGIVNIKGTDYESYLWKALTQLDYDEYEYLREMALSSFPYNNVSLLVNFKYSYLKLDKENYKVFKSKFLNLNKFESVEDEVIEEKILRKIKNDIEESLSIYDNYVEKNFFSVREKFSNYKKNIRIYLLRPVLDKDKEANYLFKIVSYNSLTPSVNIYNRISSFSIRLGNLEEIEAEKSDDILIRVNKNQKNFFEKIFSESKIFYELIEIFIRYADESILFDFSVYLLRLKNIEIQEINKEFQFIKVKKDENIIKYVFFLSKNITNFNQLNLSNTEKMEYVFLTKPDSRIINNFNKESINYLSDFLSWNFFDPIFYFLKDKLSALPNIKKGNDFSFVGQTIIDKLQNCPLGKEGWNKFENIGVDIFQYLFKDNFRLYIAEKQSITDDKIFRRDYVVNNLPLKGESFWSDIKKDFGANICIVEFKNYSEALNSSTLFDTSKYLISPIGNFILIFSRYGLDNSAKKLQKKLLNEKKILVIVLTENEIIEMIREKILGIDVSYRLENIKFEILKSL